jgi:tetrathionate reductase subunit C
MSPLMINEVLAHPQDVTWLPWAVQYFFFIGIAACSALLACGLRGRHAGLERLTLLIGLTCAIAAPLALTADLHQTARVWHFYAWPTPWSWMPWGALFLPLFTGFIGLWFIGATVQHIYGKTFAWTRWMAYACALTAIGLLLYTGREVSVVRARPIWFSWWFPLAMFLSAFQTLLALLIAASRTPALQLKLARGLDFRQYAVWRGAAPLAGVAPGASPGDRLGGTVVVNLNRGAVCSYASATAGGWHPAGAGVDGAQLADALDFTHRGANPPEI